MQKFIDKLEQATAIAPLLFVRTEEWFECFFDDLCEWQFENKYKMQSAFELLLELDNNHSKNIVLSTRFISMNQ